MPDGVGRLIVAVGLDEAVVVDELADGDVVVWLDDGGPDDGGALDEAALEVGADVWWVLGGGGGGVVGS